MDEEETQLRVCNSDHQRLLSEALWNLRTEGILCDVILDVGGDWLWAHRVVLCASSSYLKHLCISPAIVTSDGTALIRINLYSFKVCLCAIEYLYTGRTISFEDSGLVDEFSKLCHEWELLKVPLKDDSKLSSCNSILFGPSTVVTNTHPIKQLNAENTSENCFRNFVDNRSLESQNNKCQSIKTTARKKGEMKIRTQGEFFKNGLNVINFDESNNGVNSLIGRNDINPHGIVQEMYDSSKKTMKPDPDDDYNDSESINCNKSLCDTNITNQTLQLEPGKVNRKNKKKRGSVKRQQADIKTRTRSKKLGSLVFKRNCCQPCGLDFTSREEYLMHRKEAHPKSPKYWCNICNKKLPDANLLQLHNMEQHWKEGMKLAKKYICTEPGCNFFSFIYATWHKHKTTHCAEPRVCEICGKTLKNEFTLKQHVQNMHMRTTVYNCDACDKTFTTKGNLKQAHKEARHGSTVQREQLVCPQCAFVCWSKTSMSEHLLVKHNELVTNRKLYQCDVCDFRTTMQAKMKEHSRGHNALDRLACPECGKTYKSLKLLNRHKKIHDQTAKTTSCMYCSYKTLHGVGTLSNHLRFKHRDKNPKPWQCDGCSFKAITKESLAYHLDHIHRRNLDSYTYNIPTWLDSEPNNTQPKTSTDTLLDQSLSSNNIEHKTVVNLELNGDMVTGKQTPSTSQPKVVHSVIHVPGMLPGSLLTNSQNSHCQAVPSASSAEPLRYTSHPQGYAHNNAMVNPMSTDVTVYYKCYQ